MKKATYTTIVHNTLASSGLTVQEFFVADVVDKLSNPYCTMGRERIAELTGVSRSGLHKIVKRLEEKGYLVIEKKGLQSTQAWKDVAYTDDVYKVDTKRVQSAHQDVYKVDDSIYINNNNKDKDVAGQEERPQSTLPPLLGKTSLTRIATVYQLMWYDTFEQPYRVNYGAFTKAISPMLKEDGLSEVQIAALIIKHFGWYGTTGEDDFAQKNLESNGYPIYWVRNKMNDYSTFLTNVEHVDFEDPTALAKYVADTLREPYKTCVAKGIIKPIA